MFYPKISSSGV